MLKGTKCILVLILVMIMLMGTSAYSNKVEAISNPIKIACVGDSITQGYGTTDMALYGYPAQLQERVGSSYTVNNYGIGGRTVLKNGDYPYWNEQYFTDSQSWLPDIVILQFGTNDAKPQNWQYESQFVSNYEEMIDDYKNLSSHPTVYVMLPPTVFNTGLAGITNDVLTGQVVPLIMQVAKETGCTIIDNNSITASLGQYFPDNVHPNNTGATIIANNVYRGIINANDTLRSIGGTVTARGDNAPNEVMGNAFDGCISTKWLDFNPNSWIQYQFPNNAAYKINKYNIASANDYPTRDPQSWTLKGSNDGTNWTTLDIRSNQTWSARNTKNTYTFTNNTAYKYYKFDSIVNSGDTYTQIGEIELIETVTTAFSDTFDDNSISSDWSTYGGTWSGTSQMLKQTSTSSDDPKKAIISNCAAGYIGLSRTITAKVRVDSWTNNAYSRAGVSLFTGTGDGRGYNLIFTGNQSTVQFLDDYVTFGPSYTFNWSLNTWYWFKLRYDESASTLYGKVWQDGTTEPSIWPYQWVTSGRTGFPALNGGSGNNTVSFDNVSITN